MPYDLSVIIPTRNEADNIPVLLRRLRGALGDTLVSISSEIIFVDDSSDATPLTIARLMHVYGSGNFTVRLMQGSGDLAGSVQRGLLAAQGHYSAVLDADLQHPPEILRDLYRQARLTQADLILASRYQGDGAATGLATSYRHAVSQASRHLVKLLWRRRLRDVSDPLGGCFLINTAIAQATPLRPIGYKILLELLVRAPWQSVVAVPYQFQARLAGDSKASWRQGVLFARHLGRLIAATYPVRAATFAAVGVATLALGQLTLLALVAGLHVNAQLAYVGQMLVSVESNFLLNRRFTWRARRGAWWPTWLRFHVARLPTILFNQVLFAIMTTRFHVPVMIASLLCVAIILAVNYHNNDKFVFKDTPHASPERFGDHPGAPQSADDSADAAIALHSDL